MLHLHAASGLGVPNFPMWRTRNALMRLAIGRCVHAHVSGQLTRKYGVSQLPVCVAELVFAVALANELA